MKNKVTVFLLLFPRTWRWVLIIVAGSCLYLGLPSWSGADALAPKGIIPVDSVEIVSIHFHDPQAFTQGLSFADGRFYEGTGIYGKSTLSRRTIDGKNIELRRLPAHLFGEGITVFEDRVLQLSWKSRTGIVWDREKLKLKGTFTYPTEGWGLTHDGRHLIMSDGSATLYFLDPYNFSLEKRLVVADGQGPVKRLNELEFIRGEIWANIWKEDRVARIDPENGQVIGWLDFSDIVAHAAVVGEDNVLNGIAYDRENDRVFVTGKRWNKLFEVKIGNRKDHPPPDEAFAEKEHQ